MKSAMSKTLCATAALLLIFVSSTRAGVVGLWEYDTSAGTAVVVGQTGVGQVDETGGHASGPFNGTGYGGTLSYQAGAIDLGHSLQFTAATSPYDYVGLSLPAAVGAIGQGAFTIETWFKTTDTGRSTLVGTFYGTIQDDINFEITANGEIRGHIGSPTAVTDFHSSLSLHSDVADGQWHHGAFVRESVGGAVRLYLDGVEVGNATDLSGAFTLTAPTLYLARDYRTGVERFDGSLDKTRVSNTALTPEQFLIRGYGEQNYYRMETDGGATVSAGQSASVVDDTGLHPFTYNGTASSASSPTYSNHVVADTILRNGTTVSNSHSISFDGTGGYVELGDQPLLTTLTEGDFTIEFFLKTPSRESRAVVLGTFDNDPSYVLNLEIGGVTHGENQGHLRAFLQSLSSSTQRTDFFGDTDVSDDEWHHVALVRSGAGTGSDLVQLYVDYALDGQMALNTGTYTLRPDFFRLGRDVRGSGYFYEGLLDEFRISASALDVSEFLFAVPEPGSITMLISAGAGLLVLWRRRGRRVA